MNTNTPQNQEAPLLTWKAPSHQMHERSKKWYIAASIVTGFLFFYSIVTSAWSFTAVLIIGAAVYVFMHRTAPGEKIIAISKSGITFNGEFIPWLDLNGFWILTFPNYAELHIAPKSKRRSELIISTGPADILKLRELLSQFLAEQFDKNEKIFDKVARVCKL